MRRPVRSYLLIWAWALTVAARVPAADVEPAHAENDLYASLLRDGATLAGAKATFPAPLLRDDDTPAVEQEKLRKLAASSNRDLKDLLRDAATADFISKPRDEKAGDGTILRYSNFWFVVHAGLDAFDPDRRPARKGEAKPTTAAGMTFSSKPVGDDELKARKVERADPRLEWFTHSSGDLLDRIHVDSTDRARGSRSSGSWAFATRTDRRFDDDPQLGNRWWAVDPNTGKMVGQPRPYAGGASTTKISRLASVPGALLIEAHYVFAEPLGWFDGGATLRSKITLAAQDQIRRLRRELKEHPAP